MARGSLNDPFQLYVRDLDTRVARPIARLTAGAGPASPAQWTTGGKILFWDAPGLWPVSPLGAPAELIATIDLVHFGVLLGKTMHVTQDGQVVAGVGRAADGAFGVWTARLPGAVFEKYEPDTFAGRAIYNDPALRFSPDARHLLLMWNVGRGGEEAWLLPFPPDASRPPRRVLESLPAGSGTPEFPWLPDNRHVVVATGTDLRRALYVADTQSGAFRLFSSGHGDQGGPVVSPDGDKLVFTDLERAFDIVMVDLATAAVEPLIATDRAEVMPSWAPGGGDLVYVTDRAGAWEIWLHHPPQPDRPIVTARDFSDGDAVSPCTDAVARRRSSHLSASRGARRGSVPALDVRHCRRNP